MQKLDMKMNKGYGINYKPSCQNNARKAASIRLKTNAENLTRKSSKKKAMIASIST
jgi:hypothetical protein